MEDLGAPQPKPDRYLPRRDVSQVPPQGAYAAKRCPLRVQYDSYPPAGAEPAPDSPHARHLMDEGNRFEASIFAELLDHTPSTVDLSRVPSREERVQGTLRAMTGGAPLVLGGELPLDAVGRRVGKPDVLVRAERRPDAAWAYHPVDVKHHKTVEPKPGAATLLSPLHAPAHASGAERPDLGPRANQRDDLLQLAHYVRMLEASGHASAVPAGGIIGKERTIAWSRLDEKRLQQTWDRARDRRESPLERYDFEFSFRLDVLAAAAAGDQIVEPARVSECGQCPWREICDPVIEARDCVTLLPRVGYREWHSLRRLGISSRADLADLDPSVAALGDALRRAGHDLTNLRDAAGGLDPQTPLTTALNTRSRKVPALLEAHGITTAGDLQALRDADLVASERVGGGLAVAIDQALVATQGGGLAHRQRGVADVEVPRADVEIDIDMESTIDGTVYLWGACREDLYEPFVCWEPHHDTLEAQVFAEFWRWLTDRRHHAHERGQSIAVYCWSAGAEAGALRSGARAVAEHMDRSAAPEEVEGFLESGELVDLRKVFEDQLITGTGVGLKVIAPLAGFSWHDDAAGGDNSMLWHLDAVSHPDPAERSANRVRLLTYNADDVRATARIREWMTATTFPSVADLRPARS